MSARGRHHLALMARAAEPVSVGDWALLFKAFADETRLAILDLVASLPLPDQTWTAGQIAERLGIQTVNVYYHINTLEAAQLLAVHHTRDVNGITEKHYCRGKFLRHKYGRMLRAMGRTEWEVTDERDCSDTSAADGSAD